jgi:hypothetical protein
MDNGHETDGPHRSQPEISHELYERTLEALQKQGYRLIVDIEPKSIAQLAIEKGGISIASEAAKEKATVPQRMQVAVNPTHHLTTRDWRNPRDMAEVPPLEKEEARLKSVLPEDVARVISMPLPCASVILQVALQKVYNFNEWWAIASDRLTSGKRIIVGRLILEDRPDHYTSRLAVDTSGSSDHNWIYETPVVVLPQITI